MLGARTVQEEPSGSSKDGLGTHPPKNGGFGIRAGFAVVALEHILRPQVHAETRAPLLGRPYRVLDQPGRL